MLKLSLALLSLSEKVKSQSPHVISNADIVMRDQFVECVSDNALRQELKQLIRCQPTVTLLFGGKERECQVVPVVEVSRFLW